MTKSDLEQVYLASAFQIFAEVPLIPYDKIPVEYHGAVRDMIAARFEECKARAKEHAERYATK